jgi:hypothetical protein
MSTPVPPTIIFPLPVLTDDLDAIMLTSDGGALLVAV